ncbi:MAG: YutD family protein [Mollicutes bacterium]|nr:YutD family protein [Mollicutes bacterium]
MKIKINEIEYEIIENNNDAIEIDVLEEKITDYFDSYDYIVGDWAYGKIRLKGFNDKKNKNFKEINNYKNINTYIERDCAFGCRYFILKRIAKK